MPRSTQVPINGDSNTCGSKPIMEAIANVVAEFVLWVRYQMMENCTNWLPNRDNACPVHNVKYRTAHLLFEFSILISRRIFSTAKLRDDTGTKKSRQPSAVGLTLREKTVVHSRLLKKRARIGCLE